MAQENTAINDLIHLVTARKLERESAECESAEDLFWARNQVNLRGQRAANGTPAPAPVATLPMGSMPVPPPQLAGGSAPMPLPTAPQPMPSSQPMTMLPMTTTLPMGSSSTSMGTLPATPGALQAQEPATPGARHAARVASARANVASGGPAARVAAARSAAARALAARGAAATAMQGVPSASARAIAANHAATMRGVMPIFHDPDDDEATVRVDSWMPRHAQHMAYAAPSAAPAPYAGAPYAAPLPEPTMRVTPLAMALPSGERRPFVAELVHTVKRFAAPLTALMVLAVFTGAYFALDGRAKQPRPAQTAPAATEAAKPEATRQAPAAQVTPIENSVSAVMASKLAEAQIEESLELAKGAVVVGEEAGEQAEDEIEMDAVDVAKSKRSARAAKRKSGRVAAIAKANKREDRKRHKKSEKADKSVAEGTLPANVANKTDRATGKVSITSNVPAMIYVDGRSTQMMTPKKFAVPAGKHKITLLEPSTKKAKTQDIEIEAGKIASVDKQF